MTTGYSATFLGCGTSTGVPVLGCSCAVCTSTNPKNKRTRAALHITTPKARSILIDTSIDFRQQALREEISRVDAVLYTHYHSDHILGLEDLRGYNFKQGGAIPIYGSASTLAQIQRIFDYIFTPDPTYVGGQVPQIISNEIPLFGSLSLFEETIELFDLAHGNITVSGFKFGSFAYATDCKELPERTKRLLTGIDTLVLDGLRYEQHKAHFTIPEAIAMAQELGVRRTILTHMTHGVEFDAVSAKLPAGIELAYDGMKLRW